LRSRRIHPLGKEYSTERDHASGRSPILEVRSIRFSSLVRGDEEHQSIIDDIEKNYSSLDTRHDEKLRLPLLALRKSSKPSGETFESDIWTKEIILRFIQSFQTLMNGFKMSLIGISKETTRLKRQIYDREIAEGVRPCYSTLFAPNRKYTNYIDMEN
jgi:hypothetical protein